MKRVNGKMTSKQFIQDYIQELKRCLDSLNINQIDIAIDMLMEAYRYDKKVFILGNGGSASTASHMACDLGKGTLSRVYDNSERRLRIISLTDNIALMTAFANDLSFDDIFIQQLRNLVDKNDVVIAISGSGNSKNVIKAVRYSADFGAKTIGILGFKTGGKLGKMVDCPIIVDSTFYGPIEDIQLILNHIMSALIAKIKHIHDREKKVKNQNKAVPFK